MKLDENLIEQCLAIAPEFAPLPKAFLRHLLLQEEKHFREAFLFARKGTNVQENFLERIWTHFIYYRSIVYSYVSPFVEARRVASKHGLTGHRLLDALGRAHPLYQQNQDTTPSPKTLHLWREKHLLIYDGYDFPRENNACSLLLMRYLLTKSGGWLPRSLDEKSSHCWVWYLLPGGEITPCSLSQIQELPPYAFIFSTWPGVVWDNPGSWTILSNKGAMRWAGTIQIAGKSYWSLSPEHLLLWKKDLHIDQTNLAELEQSIAHLPHHFVGESSELQQVFFHGLAEGLLSEIGIPIFLKHLYAFYGARNDLCVPTLFSLLERKQNVKTR